MKLTNRDKFISDMFDLYLDAGWNPRDIHFSLLDVRSNIDSPEYEVEAIPIEWLKEFAKQFEKRAPEMSKPIWMVIEDVIDFWEFQNDDTPDPNKPKDWKKENEQVSSKN